MILNSIHYYIRFLVKKAWKPIIPVFTGTLFAIFLVGSLILLPDGRLHLKFLDVGEGDSIFIKTSMGSTILIDGGPNKRAVEMLSWDLGFFDRSIDVVILTHPHADHVSGLIDVLRRYRVKNVIFNTSAATETFKSFLKAVEEEELEGAKVIKVKKGDKITVGEVVLDILHPETAQSSPSSNPNNDSIATLLRYREFDAFLPGDLEVDHTEKLLAKVRLPPIEVLKVAHQGASNGLTRNILMAIKPQISVISVGKNNKYGHPSPKVIRMISDIGSKLMRTDEEGTIEVISDGYNVWLKK